MKVLQINAVYAKSSTGRTCKELENELVKQGHEVKTAYGNGYNSTTNSFKIGSGIDVKLHGLLSRITGKQGYFSIRATKKLLRYIEEYKPDIVHLRNLHANYINFKLLTDYLAKNDIITVLTLHDCWFMTGKCTHYTIDNCRSWIYGCGNCRRLKKDNCSWFFDRTALMWQDKKEFFNKIHRLAVVGVSDWITNEAKESLLKNAEIIKRIYNWIDLEQFKISETKKIKAEYGIDNKYMILSVATTWGESKGINQVIELAAKLENIDVIVLIGKIPNKITLPDNVIAVGTINNIERLAEFYSAADCYISFSYEESFGKSVAEAIACGTPAIVYNTTALPEIVNEGCGIVIGGKDDLIEAIDKIKLHDKKFYEKSCREYAESNFSMETNISEYVNLYNELIYEKKVAEYENNCTYNK